MPNSKIILTKTSRPNATPHPNDLDYGELAINYEDGFLFFKNSSNRISKIASSGSFSQLTRHLADRENPHEVTKDQIGLDQVDNSSDLNKPISNAAQTALDKKVNLTTLNANYYTDDETDAKISQKFSEIDVRIENPTPTAPAGSLSYASNSNTFSYIQPTIPTLSDLGGVGIDDIFIQPLAPSSGSGTLSYLGNGIFSYDKPTIRGIGGYARTEIGLKQKTADRSLDGTLTYNDGFFTYDKPTIAGITEGKITLVDGVLDIEGFVTDAELNTFKTKEGQDITSLQSQITSNDNDITDLKGKDVNLQSQITSNDNDIAVLQNRVTSNDNDITAIQNKNTSQDGNITSLSNRITSNDNDIAVLQNRVTSNDNDITAIQNKNTSQDVAINNKVSNLGSVTGIIKLTQGEYDALTPNASTVYIIVD
jgi:hypothetical protein